MRVKSTDIGQEEIAKSLMREILYANGIVCRFKKEVLPKKWVKKIARASKVFFEANAECLTNNTITLLADGEEGDVSKKFGRLSGFAELRTCLDSYFIFATTNLN